MRKEQERHSAITVEYLILLLLVIGVGASMTGLKDSVKNYVVASSNNIQEISNESTSQNQENSKITGNLLITSNTDTSSAQDDIVPTVEQQLLAKNNLEDYTWSELKTIANDLSENNTNSAYYTHMLELMQSGSTKTFVINDTTGEIGTSMTIRIIGICQDVKSDGTGQAGLTFQTAHALATCQTMNSHAENTGGWGTSRLEQWVNSTFLNSLPNELATNIVSVTKYYNPTWNSTSTDTITSADDKAFILSYKEMFNYTNNDYPWYALEGTGENHDQQYQYYAYNEITVNNLKTEPLKQLLQTVDNETPAYNESYYGAWARNVSSYSNYENNAWNTSGLILGAYAYENNYSIAPAFCL